ncbi:MAG TPA: ferredoxin [Bdellovibrionales bacterium]|nr:ferredoxin [Bdellovibrionales bacterium]HCM40792.1 ferredoxin [Bdellovibrionales bacterium]
MSHMISKACTKCGACITECPTGSIVEGKNQYYIDADTCADHAACLNVCPVEAISPRPIPSFIAAKERLNKRDEEEEEEE